MPKFQVIGRDDAERQGLRMYYTGVPCKKGHDQQRYVINGACKDCTNRKTPPGPSLGHANVKAYPIALPLVPDADMLMMTAAVFQALAPEVVRLCNQLVAQGIEPRLVAQMAYNKAAPLFIAADRVGQTPTPGPKRLHLDSAGNTAPARVDPVTGFEIQKDADGNEQYRPNPFA